MAHLAIEDFALIGDTRSAALVSRDGAIAWACFPRFDSGACFAALLGGPEHGYWQLRPAGKVERSERCYEADTLVLRSEFHTAGGSIRITDCMPVGGATPHIVRLVEGLTGSVDVHMDLVIRFDYGQAVPWVSKRAGGLNAVCGPDHLRLITPLRLHSKDMRTTADFCVKAGDTIPLVLSWYPSHEAEPELLDAAAALADTCTYWQQWLASAEPRPVMGQLPPAWLDAVKTSLLALKAMTHSPTGGLVAAVTTSLPEKLGGARNWDYRYCWLRDASLSLGALERAGHVDEAASWYRWLLRAAAGDPAALQIMYGLAGERRLEELELPWLPGYAASKPVRTGNGAFSQFQLDVYGEVLDALLIAARAGVKEGREGWALQRALVRHLETVWQQPDCGIWEIRGTPKHFVHSKVMAWVALDRAITAAEEFHLQAPLQRWQELRRRVHEEICQRGYDKTRGIFTQSYESPALDASLLQLPLVGFLPATDPRMRRTIEAIEQGLVRGGLVRRYIPDGGDGLSGDEGAFLACSFWLVGCLSQLGRRADAEALFTRLLGLRNDVGLLAEEYDSQNRRQLGNFPQAFSHLALINAALALAEG